VNWTSSTCDTLLSRIAAARLGGWRTNGWKRTAVEHRGLSTYVGCLIKLVCQFCGEMAFSMLRWFYCRFVATKPFGAFYAAEIRTLKEEHKRRLLTFNMCCYRRILTVEIRRNERRYEYSKMNEDEQNDKVTSEKTFWSQKCRKVEKTALSRYCSLLAALPWSILTTETRNKSKKKNRNRTTVIMIDDLLQRH